MGEFNAFMDGDVVLKRRRLYLLRFALMVFAWTALKLSFLALVADGSTRTFVFSVLVEGMIIAAVISTAVYAAEANSKKAKISIFVLLGMTAILVIVDRIKNY